MELPVEHGLLMRSTAGKQFGIGRQIPGLTAPKQDCARTSISWIAEI